MNQLGIYISLQDLRTAFLRITFLSYREGKTNLASHEHFHSDPHRPWYNRGQPLSFPQSQQPNQNEQSQSVGGFLPCSCSVSFLSCSVWPPNMIFFSCRSAKQLVEKDVQSSREERSLDSEGRFQHHWITTTSISTLTPFTTTSSVGRWQHLQIVSELDPVVNTAQPCSDRQWFRYPNPSNPIPSHPTFRFECSKLF